MIDLLRLLADMISAGIAGILFGAIIFGVAMLMMGVAILIDMVRVRLRKGRNHAAPQI